MKPLLILAAAFATTLFAGTVQAVDYDVYAFSDTHHAVWVPGLDQRHLLLDPGAVLSIEDDAWQLHGDLTSHDGSKWTLSVSFSDVLTGDEFSVLTGADNGRIKGATWAQQQPDWAFAGTVSGTLTALDGDLAGHSYTLSRMAGSNDYYAQFGTCMNDKNCDVGLSTWLNVTDVVSGEVYRGDINVNVSAPVPEPSAALVFGLGTLLASSSIRRTKS